MNRSNYFVSTIPLFRSRTISSWKSFLKVSTEEWWSWRTRFDDEKKLFTALAQTSSKSEIKTWINHEEFYQSIDLCIFRRIQFLTGSQQVQNKDDK